MPTAGSDQAQVHLVQSSRALTLLQSGNIGSHDQLLQGWISAPSRERLLPTAGRHGTANSAMLQVCHRAEQDVLTRPGIAIGHCHSKGWLGCHVEDDP